MHIIRHKVINMLYCYAEVQAIQRREIRNESWQISSPYLKMDEERLISSKLHLHMFCCWML